MSDITLTVRELLDGVAIDGETFEITVSDGGLSQTSADARYVRTVNGDGPDVDGNVDVAGGGGGAVDSVNGQTGVVVLDATDVGADATGTAATAVAAHEADTTSVHGIADTSVLATDAEVATAVSDHAAAANPHPTYLTAAEGDAAYDAIGAAAAAQAASQPVDSDLTAIAALTTTSYGRALLAVADLAALRAILGPTGTPSATTFLRGDGTWNTPAGGAAGASAIVRRATGSGMAVAASTSWTDLLTSLDLTLAAATGDWVTATLLGAWSNTGSSFGCLDVVTVVSAAPVNSFLAQGAPDNALFSYGTGGVQNAFTQIGATMRYQLQSGDISGGNVLLRLRVRTSTAVAKSIHCSASEPFIFSARIN